MILVRIIIDALPEKQKEVMQTLLSMIDTKQKEKGCLSHNVFCDIDAKTVFTVIEEWKTRKDLNRYIRSERFSILLGTRSLLSKPLEMKIHTVSRTEAK
jgi:quinol monooxygenase YgiN